MLLLALTKAIVKMLFFLFLVVVSISSIKNFSDFASHQMLIELLLFAGIILLLE